MKKHTLQALFLSLEIHKQSVEKRIEPYSTEELNHKINPHTWSVLQILEHVRIAEKQTLKALLANADSHVSIPLLSHLKLWSIVAVFRLRIKLKAPSYVASKIPDVLDKGVLLQKWAENRTEWQHFISFCEQNLSTPWFIHPIIGKINVKMAMLFMIAHFKRHKEQVEKCIRNSPKP